jgi:hypothetical protein
MEQSEKIDTLIKVAKKYKIDRPKPYAKVEYWDSVNERIQVIEFGGDKEVSGWEYSGVKAPSKLAWFLLGTAWAALIIWMVIWFSK